MATGTIPTRHIETRRIAFAYPDGEVPRHFMSGEAAHSHLMAVLSSMFPEGEDFFVRSVRNYRDQLTDPELRRQVAGFIGQEAIHGREHRSLNDRLRAMGYPTRFIDRLVKHALGVGAAVLPKAYQVAITAALEHYTATLAEVILRTPELVESPRSDEVRWLLLWHAIEESEHKSVAFDVLGAVNGNERVRVGVMRATTVVFLFALGALTTVSLLLDGHTYRHPLRTARSIHRLRKAPWLDGLAGRVRDYNRRGFHPDDHDTTELLERWRAELFGGQGLLTERLKRTPTAPVLPSAMPNEAGTSATGA